MSRDGAPQAADPPTVGVVLAGGLARRMGGGDKTRIRVGGAAILDRVLARLRPQCRRLVLSAAGDPARFADTGLPVIADSVPDYAGPLAGILAGLDWAASGSPQIEWLVSVPGDCPFLPRDLLARLHRARIEAGGEIACAASGKCRHPVVALWPVAMREELRRALPCRRRRMAGRGRRPVLQRQHRRRRGRSRPDRCAPSRALRSLRRGQVASGGGPI
jgi:molybdenum cofactor guanylyltransferase